MVVRDIDGAWFVDDQCASLSILHHRKYGFSRSQRMAKAIYAFSGDPITYGHIDIIQRAADVFEHLIVGIGVNPQKKYLFSLDERAEMARLCLKSLPNVVVTPFSGLLVDYAYENGVSVVVKGVRNPEDFNYENVLHQVGESQSLGIDTHILFARPELGHVSSGAVKEIQRNQGSIHEYVPLLVKQRLEEKVSGQYVLGVTGEMGSGKSYICDVLESIGTKIPVHNIELDHIAHSVLGELRDPVYQQLREQIAEAFGKNLLDSNGFINRKALGVIVFNDAEQLRKLNQMMYRPITVRLRREMMGRKGLILINAALLVETDMTHLCNNNVVLIHVDKETQNRRLRQRDLTNEQIRTRVACQYNCEQKKTQLGEIIDRDGHGHIWTIDNSNDVDKESVRSLLDDVTRDLGIACPEP
jgi:pantetheine-phosphate adenylyltransferase